MFKDINFNAVDGTENYTFEVVDGEIIISLDTEKYVEFDLYYDDNIYDKVEILNDVKIREYEKGGFLIEDIKDQYLKAKVIPNFKYLMKRFYEFINRFINKEALLEELRLFSSLNVGEQYINEIKDLINNIDDKELVEILLEEDKELDRVEYILLNSKLYNTLDELMTDKDYMLLITSYISVPRLFSLTQEEFNKYVNIAKELPYANENIWRLAMNYDFKGLDYSLIDEYFVKEKNVYYLVEYLSAVIHVNQGKVIDMVIEDNDKEFIKGILDDEFIYGNIDDELIDKLKNALK